MTAMMLEPRLYSPDPPAARTFVDDKPTLLVSWWCSGFALTIIGFRIAGRYIRTEKLFREDKIMALALIPLFLRMGAVHVVLLYGTNNAVLTGLSDESIRRRRIGSQCVLAARILFAATLWIEKLTITEFFKRITGTFWKRSYELGLQGLRWFLLLSFIAVVIATLSECTPFDHYWQVVPDPGPQCRQAYGQLLTMGCLNVITDLLLVAFPIPIILHSAMKKLRKFELMLLFALSLFPIGVTLYRVPGVISHNGRQQFRTLWASVEILFATAVTNALVLGSFVRDRGPKKMKFKFGSASDSLSRPATRHQLGRTDAFWGSDEDLVRGLGLNLNPELRGIDTEPKVRPAPIAVPAKATSRKPPPVDITAANWRFPTDEKSDNLTEFHVADGDRSPGEVSVLTPRKVSFFDVGGLLENGTPRPSVSTGRTPDRRHSVLNDGSSSGSRQGSSQQSRAGSHALQDIGGLLAQSEAQAEFRPPRATSRNVARNEFSSRLEARDIMAALREASPNEQGGPRYPPNASTTYPGRQHSLSDVGGLLSDTGPSKIPEETGSRPNSSSRPRQQPTGLQSLQDVGGLLSSPEIPNRTPSPRLPLSTTPPRSKDGPPPSKSSSSSRNPSPKGDAS